MFIKKELTISLPYTEQLQARIIIEHDGQDVPCRSDQVKTIAKILLPCKRESHYNIDPEIIFGDRLSIAGENLYCGWGSKRCDNYKEITKEFFGNCWSEIDVAAEIWAENEIGKLVDILEKRYQALLDADR